MRVTTNRSKAEWFAKRFPSESRVLVSAEILGRFVWADYRGPEGRGESEVVVDPLAFHFHPPKLIEN